MFRTWNNFTRWEETCCVLCFLSRCKAVLLRQPKGKKRRCLKKGRISDSVPLLHYAPDIAPEKVLELAYYFAQAQSVAEAAHEASIEKSDRPARTDQKNPTKSRTATTEEGKKELLRISGDRSPFFSKSE